MEGEVEMQVSDGMQMGMGNGMEQSKARVNSWNGVHVLKPEDGCGEWGTL